MTSGRLNPGTYRVHRSQSRAESRALEDEPDKVWTHLVERALPSGHALTSCSKKSMKTSEMAEAPLRISVVRE